MTQRRASVHQRVLGEQAASEKSRLETEHGTDIGEGEDPFVLVVPDPALGLLGSRAVALPKLRDGIEQDREHEPLLRTVRQPDGAAGEELIRQNDIRYRDIGRSTTGVRVGSAGAGAADGMIALAGLDHGGRPVQKQCQPTCASLPFEIPETWARRPYGRKRSVCKMYRCAVRCAQTARPRSQSKVHEVCTNMERNLLVPLPMRKTKSWIVAASFVVALLPARPAIAEPVVIADDDRDAPIQVEGVTLEGNTVTGTLVDRGSAEVRDIRLLVDVEFLWANETKPGDDNPGRAIVFTVAGPLPPHGTLKFTVHPEPPLEERADGRYRPKIRVMSYETVTVGNAAP